MSITSALSTSAQGILAGINRTAISAGRIEQGVAGSPEVAATMVGLSQGAIDTRASVSVLKAADEMLGTLIDIHAR